MRLQKEKTEIEEREEIGREQKQKKIVIPGELITDQRKRLGQHTFIENGKVYSDSLGITYPDAGTAYVVPLHGRYIPVRNDLIIGIVSGETFNSYIIDINSIYRSFVSKDAIRYHLKRGSVISAIIKDVNEINEADLVEIRVFYDGEVVEVSPAKVPRVIGRNGSMLKVLKDGTGCSLVVGRNGWVWVKNGDIALCVKAIRLIEKEAHLSNLTNRVDAFLKEKKGEKQK